MNNAHTEIVLDRSGSMQAMVEPASVHDAAAPLESLREEEERKAGK
jgi:dsDNA-specific endonuclease/ATPase MutS2